jgi:CHAT domain-containing protein/Flp pilus assembly protein TadD
MALHRFHRLLPFTLAVVLLQLPGPLQGQSPPDTNPPKAETAAESAEAKRKQRFAERDDLWREAQQLRSEGKLAEAIAAGRKVLALEREILAPESVVLSFSMRWIAETAVEAEDFTVAEGFRGELLDRTKKLFGETHWKVTDARFALDDVHTLRTLSREQRMALRETLHHSSEATELLGAGKYTLALRKVERVRDIRKQTLGENHPNYGESLNALANLYRHMGDDKQAEPLYVQAHDICKKTLGEKHPDYATSLSNLAGLYKSKGDYARAEPLYLQARDIRKQALGENHPDFATTLHDLANLYQSIGDYARAEPLYVQACDISKQTIGENHPDYAKSLNNLAVLYDRMRDYDRAEPLYVRAHDICKKTLGENHPNYVTSMDNLAGLYQRMGNYARAEPLYVQARDTRKQTIGENHPDYAKSLNDLASLYEKMGDYARAEPLYVQARDICKQALGENHPDYATSLNNLALLYANLGDYARAEPLSIQACDIYKQALGENHPNYATSLSSLAALYVKMGDYARAEPLFAQARDIWKQALGENHPDYARSLNNLAVLYHSMGDYTRAEPLYVQAHDICKKTLGEKHPDYATSLNGLASLYEKMGDYARAESLFVQARDIRKRTVGENHPDYATSLNNLASLYQDMGDYAQAEPLFVQARDIRRRALGENHPDYAGSLNNLASLYEDMGDYTRAESLVVEASDIWKRVLGDVHPHYAISLSNLSFLYASMGDYTRAEPNLRQALGISRSSLEAASLVQSERQQLAMGQSLRYQLDNYVSLGLNSGRYGRSIFQEVLSWKGATLVRQRGIRLAAIEPAVSDSLAELQRTAGQLAALSRVVPNSEEERIAWRRKLNELTLAKERQEATLNQRSAAFRQATRQVSVESLLEALPSDAVLVDYLEFVRYIPPHEKGERTKWERQFVAFVVRRAERPEDQVKMIGLGPVEPVNEAIEQWRETFSLGEKGISAGKLLRETLWEPLLSSIGEPKTILISTDGILGRLSFAALPGREPDKYLLEEYRLAMLPVPQLLPHLIANDKHSEADHELLLVGDVSYGQRPEMIAARAPKRDRPRRPGENHRAPTEGQLFTPLTNTAGEVATIQQLFATLFQTHPGDPEALLRQRASERLFRELAPRYRHVHLATHGFFAPPKYASALGAQTSQAGTSRVLLVSQEAAVVGYNPGLLSGLALAGANLEPSEDGDDGILTSLEIGVLPLNNVDTVVLSACDTGLGKTAGGEGLLGVQRAFQVAGARTTVASYWKVDDLVTRLLMERFYQNLWEKEMSRLDALREAQLYVLNNPDKLRGLNLIDTSFTRTSPRLWAAFALSGDWR